MGGVKSHCSLATWLKASLEAKDDPNGGHVSAEKGSKLRLFVPVAVSPIL